MIRSFNYKFHVHAFVISRSLMDHLISKAYRYVAWYKVSGLPLPVGAFKLRVLDTCNTVQVLNMRYFIFIEATSTPSFEMMWPGHLFISCASFHV